MTWKEAISLLEDMQPAACTDCTLKSICAKSGTGACVAALQILRDKALAAVELQIKINSGELVPVVRCKYCKHWVDCESGMCYRRDAFEPPFFSADDFCNHGVKMDKEALCPNT